MVKMEIVSPDGSHNLLLGITRAEFEHMIGKGTIFLKMDDAMKQMDGIFLIGGESDESIQREVDKKMQHMPEG